MELPEKTAEHKQSGKYGAIASLLLIAAIISIAFLVYLKNQGVNLKELKINELISKGIPVTDKKEAGEVISEFKHTPEESAGFGVHDGYIIKCTQDSIRFLDKYGDEQWSKPVALNNPMVKSAGSYLMVADSGGKDIYIIKGQAVRWSEKLENTIINADINEKGYVSIVTEMKGYKGAVIVYDAYGNWIFTTARAEDHILSARVLPSSKTVLITTVNVSGNSIITNLEFVDMNGKTFSTLARKDEIVSYARELSGGWIAAASSGNIFCFNSSKDIKWEHDFDRVYSTAALSGKYMAAAVEEKDEAGLFNNAKTYIKIIDAKGNTNDIYTVESGVVNLKAYDGMIAVNTGKEVHFINSEGLLEAEYKSKVTVDNIFFLNKNEAVVISKNSVAVVKIK